MKAVLSILFVGFTFFLSSGFSFAQKETQPFITLQKPGCRGYCPTYIIKIYADGRAVLEGKRNIEHIGVFERKLPQGLMDSLTQILIEANFLELLEDYTPPYVADLPYNLLTVRFLDVEKTVKFSSQPEKLAALDKRLYFLVQEKEGWKKTATE